MISFARFVFMFDLFLGNYIVVWQLLVGWL